MGEGGKEEQDCDFRCVSPLHEMVLPVWREMYGINRMDFYFTLCLSYSPGEGGKGATGRPQELGPVLSNDKLF